MRNASLLWRSTVGQKALAATSGLALAAWVVAHLLGNLTLFAGPTAADGYAARLHQTWPLLWAARLGVLTAAVVHVATVAALTRRARQARPLRTRTAPPQAWVSRTMRVGGVLLLVFIVLHLLHLTFGVLHPRFQPGRVHANVVSALHPTAVACGYLLAAALVGLHLFHGLWSAFRSGGIRAHGAGRLRRPLVGAVAAAVALGFASIPLAVLAGVLR